MIPLSSLIHAVVIVIVAGLIFGLLYWLIGFVNPPEPFKKVAMVLLAALAVLFLISVLMWVAGFPLVGW